MTDIKLNEEQKIVIEEAIKFYDNPNQQVFQYAGYPGTGKTFILHLIIEALGLDMSRVAPMAYIGQAAVNMRLNDMTNAKTIHSWIYKIDEKMKRDSDGNILLDPYFKTPITTLEFVYNKDAFKDIDLIIIDEAGSVPLSLKKDIERAGIKIIATGDLGQLPPPCDVPAYLNSGQVFKLTKIMRQENHENNGILQLFELAKNKQKIKYGKYGNNCIVIPESQLTNNMLKNADIVICGTNRTRDKYNKLIRETIFERTSEMPEHDDMLVSRQNNWQIECDGISLANGLRFKVASFPDISNCENSGKTLRLDLKADRIPTSGLFKEIELDIRYLNSDYNTRNRMRNSKFSNGHKFEYGYVITTHMAQGAQYDNVVYIAEYFGDLTHNLNFTGITRAKKNLIYVVKEYN